MIRKVTIGTDYKMGMHYELGQFVIDRRGEHKISLIKKTDTGSIKIYISNSKNEHMQWKEFNSAVPMSIEYDVI